MEKKKEKCAFEKEPWMYDHKTHSATLILNQKREVIKFFKIWGDSKNNRHIIEIKFKDKKTGEKICMHKEYTHVRDEPVISRLKCDSAIKKYWTGFSPQKHHMVHSSGHYHDVKKKKKKG